MDERKRNEFKLKIALNVSTWMQNDRMISNGECLAGFMTAKGAGKAAE